MAPQLTLSVIKADVGGYVGHSSTHPALIDEATERLEVARRGGTVIDFHVASCGDDLGLVMTHAEGVDSGPIHRLAWDVFGACTSVARRLKLCGAGQDLVKDTFAGSVRSMGPGVAEMTIVERPSETVLVFFADKASAGAWNLPLYRMFADPFNTAGLVLSSALHQGFLFQVLDVRENRRITLTTPEELYDLLVFIGTSGRYVVSSVCSRATGAVGAVSSTQRLSLIAGRYVGKDDPVCIVRAQSEFPAVGEVLEPFTMPHIVQGWLRGAHYGPLMPCRFADAHPSRFDGPPRVIALGFQVADGRLIGPRDMFDDPGFDEARRMSNVVADQLRRHGPFEPHRLPMEEMEYTTLPEVMARLADRWQPRNGRSLEPLPAEVIPM